MNYLGFDIPLKKASLQSAIRLWVCLLTLGGAALTSARADELFREFYVSPAGDDANPGTLAKPFRTLGHTRDVVRTVNQPIEGNIIVWLRGGTYPLAAPIEFGAADSGVGGHQIVYAAYAQEVPVLSGGVLVTNWTREHGQVYSARLDWDGKLRGLFVNGVRAEMTQGTYKGQGAWGHFTVKGNEPWAETPGETLDGIQFDAVKLPVFANPADVELAQHRIFNSMVLCARDMVVESNHTIVKLQQPSGAIAATMAWGCNLKPTGDFIVRNAYELLSQPGEFYFNRSMHRLYYIARPGEDVPHATIVAPLSEGLVRIAGDSTSDRVKNLAFSGLTFAYDHWLLEKVGDSRGLVGVQSLGLYTRFRADGNWHKDHYDLCDLPQATVNVRNAENIRFERNRFTHLGSGVAVSLVNDVTDSAVTGNVFDDLSGNAVNLGHPTHYVIGGGPLFKPGVAGVCARDVVRDNWIRRVSLDFQQEEAISGFFTEAADISHNDIAGVPYGGIALGWWWGNAEIPASKVPKNNTIAFNRIVDTQQLLPKDGGALYVLGVQPGGRIEGNYIQSNTRLLYLDDGSADWTVTRNVLDPRDTRNIGKSHPGMWLHLWTTNIHDLTITDNFTTITNVLNKGVHCEPVRTRVENPLSAQAQTIVEATGLEPEYRDIAGAESGSQSK